MAWVSEVAKIAVGGSYALSSWAACSAAVAASCGPRRTRPASKPRQAWSGQSLPVSAQPVGRRGEAQAGWGLGERHVAHEPDPAVAKPDQVAGGHPPARHVVDDRLRSPGGDRVHADKCHPGLAELPELLAGQRQADRQHAVGAVRGQQRLQVTVALGRGVHVADDRVVALLGQHRERAGHPDHSRRPGHVRHQDRDRPGSAADQRRRGVTGPVTRPVDGIPDSDVDPVLRQSRPDPAEAGERYPGLGQQDHPRVLGLQLGEQKGVYRPAGDQAAHLFARIPVRDDDHHAVAPAGARRRQRLQELLHDVVAGQQLDAGHDVGQLSRPPRAQAPRAVVRVVSQGGHGLQHPDLGGLTYPAAVVEHVRDRLPADACGPGHILNRYLTCGGRSGSRGA
jgi:hypothetical protein